MLRKINNKSDFSFLLRLTDSDGNPVGWLDANWLLTLYTTSKTFKYEASHAFGDKYNCRNEDGEILILVDSHEFPVGELLMDFEIDLPDPKYPDGNHHVVVTGEKTGVEMVLDRGQEVTGLAINLRVPHVQKPASDPDAGKDQTGGAEEGDATDLEAE